MNTIIKGTKKQNRFDALYQARMQVVKLLKEGRSNKEIAAILDVSKSYVSKIKCDYEHNGLAALQIFTSMARRGAKKDVKFNRRKSS